MDCVRVELGERSYDISIDPGLLESWAAQVIATLATGSKIAIVSHPRLACYAKTLTQGLRMLGCSVREIVIPAGERYKNLKTVARLYDEFLEAALDRKSLVIAVGGGVLGDTVGFAAACYLRGIAFVQVPTTLLAQVDSSIGGKTGIDLPQGKNLVGAFHQPKAVFIDPLTLKTLPMSELRSGLAEVIKYGIIYDNAMFARLERTMPLILKRDPIALTYAIKRSCEIKADVVGQDETEQGLRAILNFGHTLGHALESVTGYRRYRHGEAIAIGMVSAALIGEELGVTPPEDTKRIVEMFRRVPLPVLMPEDVSAAQLLEAAQRDKKTVGGRLHFVLADSIGKVRVVDNVSTDVILTAMRRQRDM